MSTLPTLSASPTSSSSRPNAAVLKASGLAKSYDGEPVFADVNLLAGAGDRIGLVGPNGAGKSTLLRLLAGRDKPDAGSVSYGPDARVGYLDGQVADPDATVGSYLDAGLGDLPAIAAAMRSLEVRMAHTAEQPHPTDQQHSAEQRETADQQQQQQVQQSEPHDSSDGSLGVVPQSLLADYATLQDQFELLGGWTVEARSAQVCEHLGVAGIDRDTRLVDVSGGQQARLMLARLLLEEPSILLLDEPTNHLDLAGVRWLAEYLAAYRGAVVVSTHDRAFLDTVVDRVVELDVLTDTAETYEGGYTSYRAEKQRRRARLLSDWEAQEKYRRRLAADIERTFAQALHTELSTHNDKARRYAKKVARKAKARERRLRREMLSARWIEHPEERPPLVLDFAAMASPDDVVLQIEDLVAHRSGNTLWDAFSAEVASGDRVLVGGENGVGKSTLLDVLAGELGPAAGQIVRNASIGVLPQLHDRLPLHMHVIDYLRRHIPVYEEDAERLLDSYLFDAEQFRRPLSTLSAGELRRLLLACLVNGGHSVLLLDEPTNYLDFESLDVLENALAGFGGTVIAVSHDQSFASALQPNRRWTLTRGADGAPARWRLETRSEREPLPDVRTDEADVRGLDRTKQR